MEHLKNMRKRVGEFAHDKKPWVKQAFYAGLGCGAAVLAASFLPCGDKLSTSALTAVGGAGTYTCLHYQQVNKQSSQTNQDQN